MSDLTRWNRAGLSKVDYVDANAAVFLEHLRAHLIRGYLRGTPTEARERDAETWFEAGSETPPPLAALANLDWAALADGLPQRRESRAERNARLRENYGAQSPDYAIEIMRAFARASHVLSGYIDAYMNEGTLRTATQWSSLANLAEMVNYVPAPAASASTPVALIVEEASDVSLVKRGLAMQTTPQGATRPVIFETLDDIACHPSLNGLRTRRWNVNRRPVDLSKPQDWHLAGGEALSPGAPVIIAPSKFNSPNAQAHMVLRAERVSQDDHQRIVLENAPRTDRWRTHYTQLLCDPEATKTAQPRASLGAVGGTAIVRLSEGSLTQGSLVEVSRNGAPTTHAQVLWVKGGNVALGASESLENLYRVRPLSGYSVDGGIVDTDASVSKLIVQIGDRITSIARDTTHIEDREKSTGTLKGSDGAVLARRFKLPAGTTQAGARANGHWIGVTQLTAAPVVSVATSETDTMVAFDGKAPKSLKVDSYYLMRGRDGTDIALRVRALRQEKERYVIQFNKPVPSPLEGTEFVGPMRRVLRLRDWNHSFDPVIETRDSDSENEGWVVFADLPESARGLIRKGRLCIIDSERKPRDIEGNFERTKQTATVVEVQFKPGPPNSGLPSERCQIRVRFDGFTASSAFVAGATRFRFNTTLAGHGETKGGKTLGSGNGELSRQSFALDVNDVSMIADARLASGVAPDMDVAVGDRLWSYGDLVDPSAEGHPIWSLKPREDGTSTVMFRRRLPTGRNNLRVLRHRVGAGSIGNQIAPYSFAKPKTKHPIVTALVQPFTPSGGADREGVDGIRTNAGGRIAANDRAVSLADFATLARRHAAIQDARAASKITQGPGQSVVLTVVPVGGASLESTLEAQVLSFLKPRSLPGVQLHVQGFGALYLSVDLSLRLAEGVFDSARVVSEARAALLHAFGLAQRGLGQPVYSAEILGVIEAVSGVETVEAVLKLGPNTAATQASQARKTPAQTPGTLRALHPTGTQLAYLADATAIAITVEGEGV